MFILLLLFSFNAHSAHGVKYGIPDHFTWTDPISALSSNGIPLSPIKKGLKELSVTGAYINVGEDDDEFGGGTEHANNYAKSSADGFGLNVSWFEALGKNWGYSVIASYTPLEGEVVALSEVDGNGNVTAEHRADIDAKSSQVLGLLVYDPYYDHKSFNIPLFIGAGFIQTDQSASLEKTIGATTYKWDAKIDFISAGIALGGSFQFNTGDFRWSPFIVAFAGTATPVYEVKVTGAGSNNFNNQTESEFEVQWLGGVAASYMPWGLSARWTPNFFGHDQSLYTLSKTWTWGNE